MISLYLFIVDQYAAGFDSYLNLVTRSIFYSCSQELIQAHRLLALVHYDGHALV